MQTGNGISQQGQGLGQESPERKQQVTNKYVKGKKGEGQEWEEKKNRRGSRWFRPLILRDRGAGDAVETSRIRGIDLPV